MTSINLPAPMEVSAPLNDGFPFDVVPDDNRQAVRWRTLQVRSALRRTLASYIEAGEHLRAVRPHIPHGYWALYVECAVEMSMSWARDCMALHERFVERRPEVLEKDVPISTTALIRLASGSDEAIDEVLERSAGGERLDGEEITALLKRHKRFPPQKEGSAQRFGPPPRDALSAFNHRGVSLKLIPQIVQEMEFVLYVLEDVQERVQGGRAFSRGKLEDSIREVARHLTDGLEQVTQLRAETDTKLTHKTFVNRSPYPPGAWADAASFLADISTSEQWERIKKDNIPALVDRGVDALRAALSC